MEEIQLFLDDAKESMEKAIVHTDNELAKIRAGKATPGMLKGIMVEYYGAPTPIEQISSISTSDARTINIKPWEKNSISEIEKAILHSDLGLNPMNNGENIIINVPALTEERRKDLVKQAKNEGENSRIRVRNIRKDANSGLRSLLKEGASEDEVKKAEDEIQKLTDVYIKKIDALLVAKEADIMTI